MLSLLYVALVLTGIIMLPFDLELVLLVFFTSALFISIGLISYYKYTNREDI